MAVTYSRNLRLRIDSNLTANAKYNLERIDLLGASLLIDTTGVVNLRSEGNITVEPESPDVGGSGLGGSVTFGSADHVLSSVSFHADSVSLGSALSLLDTAAGATRSLLVQYKSDLSGSTDTVANRTLSVDLDGADRSLILGGNFSLLGGSLALTVPSPLAINLSADGTTGQVLTTNGSGVWGWVDQAGGGTVNSYSTSWITGDGSTKVVTHSLGAPIEVSIYDESGDEILIDTINIINSSSIQLTSSESPASSWTVVVQG